MILVPVIDNNRKPLMPTTSARASRWIKTKKATPYWNRGIFCVRLNKEPSARNLQSVAAGIDTGSKKEAITLKSAAHTFLNIQLDAITHVSKAVETRRYMRRARRFRNTPYRKQRFFRNFGRSALLPSIKARWQWKLRILNWLYKIYPISHIVVEDVCFHPRKGDNNKWLNINFSPIQDGKNWFYKNIKNKFDNLILKRGKETKSLRAMFNLEKTKNKLIEVFEAHCVDSWVLANSVVGGHTAPENKDIIFISSIKVHRRQLHALQYAKNGVRRPYGGTRSLGLKRGSIVKHTKLGIVYVGGAPGGKVSLHSLETSKRLCNNAKIDDIVFLAYNSWIVRRYAQI